MRRKSERPTCGSARFVHVGSHNAAHRKMTWKWAFFICSCSGQAHAGCYTIWCFIKIWLVACCFLHLLYWSLSDLWPCRASSLRLTWKETQRVSSDRPSGSRTNKPVTISSVFTFHLFIHVHDTQAIDNIKQSFKRIVAILILDWQNIHSFGSFSMKR